MTRARSTTIAAPVRERSLVSAGGFHVADQDEEYKAALVLLKRYRFERLPNMPFLPTEAAVMAQGTMIDEMSATLEDCGRLIEALANSKKITFSAEQIKALGDRFARAKHTLARARGEQ
jgi:hypothetical protein